MTSVNFYILVPSFRWRNAFGLNRYSHVRWVKTTPFNIEPSILGSLGKRVLVLYSGTLGGFVDCLSHFPPTSQFIHCALLATYHRLDKLKPFLAFSWTRIKHHLTGGVSASQWWLGITHKVDLGSTDHPVYCTLAMFDLLEFAPPDMRVTPCSEPSHNPSMTVDGPSKVLSSFLASRYGTDKRAGLPIEVDKNIYSAYGILPFLPRCGCSESLPQVISATPFTKTRWGIRNLTLVEWVRFHDLPVSVEKWFKGSDITIARAPFFSSPPLKVCSHALWLAGLLSVVDFSKGGTHLLATPKVSVEVHGVSSPNKLLIPQDVFTKQDHRFADIKAVKEDDASVPVFLWNDRIISHFPHTHDKVGLAEQSLDVIRDFLLRIWWKRILKSFIKFLRQQWKQVVHKLFAGSCHSTLPTELQKDLIAAVDCLHYACASTWWEWKGGSRLFFWRWSPEFQTFARDGIPVCWIPGKHPRNRKPQPPVKDSNVLQRMTDKVNKVKKRGYIRNGYAHSLIRYFAVPKGENDIRMVYDGTASGFNDAVWIENFGLPTIETLIRGTDPDTWMVDLDIGDMFLNFMLHEDAQKFVGIDVTSLFPEELSDEQKTLWLVWVRLAMGLKVSPNQAIRAILFAEEFFKGFPKDPSNPFQIGSVRLNLPGSENYVPSLPWISLLDLAEQLAAILAIYVDDERIHAKSEDAAWRAAHQVSTRESYFGIQDAARKRRPPSQNAGAWAGSILRTNGTEVGKLVSEERWEKAKVIIRKWLDRLVKLKPNQGLELKELLSDRGFLIYICRTYDCMNTYLKGIHLTIDSWRPDRDDEGWKLSTVHAMMKSDNLKSEISLPPSAPDTVFPAPRLMDDLKALASLSDFESPPIIKVQTKSIYIVKYKFGDASGGGFGISTLNLNNNKFHIKSGTWSEKGSSKSSNFREFGNFVLDLEEEGRNGELDGAEVFIFTDNSTTESAFYNGTTSSKTLFNLVLRVKKLEIMHSVKIHLIHVSGKRMIAQGTDGISRGNQLEGVMAGKSMLEFVPISKSALERSPLLINWIVSWIPHLKTKFLKPEEWFWKGQCLADDYFVNCDGVKLPQRSEYNAFVWLPPPCIADVCLEELRKSKHKRPDVFHIFVCPKLMTPRWRKHLLKTCTFSFYVDPGEAHWREDMFESLLVAVYLPTLHCFPWTMKSTNTVLELERKLRQVQQTSGRSQASVLREFFSFQRNLSTMSEGLVSKLLHKGRIR